MIKIKITIMMKTAKDWIETLKLLPHPEGGYFRETYRAQGRGSDGHCHSTAIYFLLESGQISALHRIKSDEVWHFYAGTTLHVHVIDPDGNHSVLDIGPDNPQGVVPAGCWFGARVEAPDSPALRSPPDGGQAPVRLRRIGEGGYSLVGCTVAPGFEFADFELGARERLVSQFPQHRDIIAALTHE